MKRGLKAAMRELAAALAVIAVFALAFVYQPFMPALTHHDASVSLVSSQSICGSGPSDDGSASHGPCHACRSKVAILPPPPDEAVPAYACFFANPLVFEDETPPRIVLAAHYNPRAPPSAA